MYISSSFSIWQLCLIWEFEIASGQIGTSVNTKWTHSDQHRLDLDIVIVGYLPRGRRHCYHVGNKTLLYGCPGYILREIVHGERGK
jgi:hypothetical protein